MNTLILYLQKLTLYCYPSLNCRRFGYFDKHYFVATVDAEMGKLTYSMGCFDTDSTNILQKNSN